MHRAPRRWKLADIAHLVEPWSIFIYPYSHESGSIWMAYFLVWMQGTSIVDIHILIFAIVSLVDGEQVHTAPKSRTFAKIGPYWGPWSLPFFTPTTWIRNIFSFCNYLWWKGVHSALKRRRHTAKIGPLWGAAPSLHPCRLGHGGTFEAHILFERYALFLKRWFLCIEFGFPWSLRATNVNMYRCCCLHWLMH